MYLQKVISKKNSGKKLFFVGILKVTTEKSRIRIRKSVVLIRVSGSAPKFHGSTTLIVMYRTVHGNVQTTSKQQTIISQEVPLSSNKTL
jgi:hypothetical protein